jgi:hypothetical protein
MASTNSYDFAMTRDNIITDAHLYASAIGEGESPTTSQTVEAARLLNMIVKLRAADGMPLWAMKRGTILPFSNASSINTNSHVVTFYDSTYLSAAAAAAATTITVASAGTIANSDVIGVELTSGDVFWTTVSSGGGTTTLVLASGLTTAAAANNRVYAYTASADRVQRPLRVVQANILQVADSYSWPIEVVSSSDYYNLSSRTNEGVPNQVFYDAVMGAATADPTSTTNWYGTFYLWPRFQDGKKAIEFTYHRPFQDFDAATDHPDFPPEFYLPLTLELAALLGPKFGMPLEERARMFSEAENYRKEALGTVAPEGSIRFMPDYRMKHG